MINNVEFFKKLNKINSFDIKLNEVSSTNFRIKTDDHLFPEFELNEYFSLNTMMTKIENNSFSQKRIINYINNLKTDNCLHSDSDSGLIFFGIFKDKFDELYACISSQLDQTELINFYHRHALDETIANLEVRYNLLQKGHDPLILPETYVTVQREYDELRKCELSYLYANKSNYLDSLKEELDYSLKNNLSLLNGICKNNNLNAMGSVNVLNHVSIKNDFIYYFVSELQNNSLIFYNLQEGFGLLENNNDEAFLIPTASFSNKEVDNTLNINDVDIYEASILSRKNYNINRFLTRNEILDNIKNYVKSINISDINVKEVNHFIPVFLYLI